VLIKQKTGGGAKILLSNGNEDSMLMWSISCHKKFNS